MGLLLGITGSAQSGKDTFAEMLVKELKKQINCSFVLMAYAHELKLKVQKDFDLSYEQLWGSEKEIEDERYVHTKNSLYHGDRTYWTPREIMQDYGQFYRTIDYDFWSVHFGYQIHFLLCSGQYLLCLHGGPACLKMSGASFFTRFNILFARVRISHCACRQHLSSKKFNKDRAFMVTIIFVHVALGRTYLASSAGIFISRSLLY